MPLSKRPKLIPQSWALSKLTIEIVECSSAGMSVFIAGCSEAKLGSVCRVKSGVALKHLNSK